MSFNEAGAINPGKPLGPLGLSIIVDIASMRPGRLTPENPHSRRASPAGVERFNEAGAINPGKPSLMIGMLCRFRLLQ